ncbi:MAG: phospho-N-acetylmuramoyl-pentapeptide-transferase [Bacteroidales bacterium]|nr:phospho-N-acetylmuramoyl-pentapeptide-transferase [Bacteroidales bacterium]
MLYYLYEYFKDTIDFPGFGLFRYLTFRSMFSIVTALLIALICGRSLIRWLQKKQIGESIRELDLEGQLAKKGTPTMGGLLIIGALLVPILLFGDLSNIYIQLMLVSTVWLGCIGFADDYIKVFKKNKDGLHGRYKIIGQVGLGLLVGLVLCFNDQIIIREVVPSSTPSAHMAQVEAGAGQQELPVIDSRETKTTIPFFKSNEFDYAWLWPFTGKSREIAGWIIYVLAIIFIITAVSNGTNLTDGMDGLATGITIVVAVSLGILAYLSGNVIYAKYLNIMYIPHSGELVVFMAALIGALIGFLWYNAYPAQLFMGDTGSLALGGIVAVFAILIRKELLIPILCGIYLVESLSVILQRYYFKYTKYKYGTGRRIFKMAPLHHHFQKEGVEAVISKPRIAMPEAKIVIRFWIVAVLLAIISIATLKIR